MSEHTPGPWEMDHALIVGDDGTSVAAITEPDATRANPRAIDWPRDGADVGAPDRPWDAAAEANAHLIAAAPEMLAVLRAYVDVAEDDDNDPEWLADARAAIAKAEGRA